MTPRGRDEWRGVRRGEDALPQHHGPRDKAVRAVIPSASAPCPLHFLHGQTSGMGPFLPVAVRRPPGAPSFPQGLLTIPPWCPPHPPMPGACTFPLTVCLPSFPWAGSMFYSFS